MTTLTTTQCRIERVVRRGASGSGFVRAEFICHIPEWGDGKWVAVEAFVHRGVNNIHVTGNRLDIQQAAALAVAIQMAIDWVAEQEAVI